ncbi:Aste57867_21198 [Aphanomyces stellatus]|uniref:Aste57867_21198 protein n=1 Tax=Aphanomyces stellatus TaxID=120398 RepID=A0A485LLK1_9STRA|nr:hypothetical protein As57867_021130 [Aphanomyces stellatus]VFT97872.1 Aste57867_21198 [Aphanomyces stellatus]
MATTSKPAATQTERRRAAALARVRNMRAKEKQEMQRLTREIQVLEATLATLATDASGNRFNRQPCRISPFEMAQQVLRKHNAALHEQVLLQRQLAQLLYIWASAQHPKQELSNQPSWIESTLLAYPVARRQGYQWHSDRLYHNAKQLTPRPYPSHDQADAMRDAIRFEFHTTEDDVGQKQVGRMACHVQHTVFANYKTVAGFLWGCEKQQSKEKETFCNLVELDRVHAHLAYYNGQRQLFGLHVRRIDCLYDDGDRIVLTYCPIAHDECFPRPDGDLLYHGFGWTVLERVTDDITLVRFAAIYPPLTKQGAAAVSLAETGQLYGLSADGVAHREAYIERIRAAAEDLYTRGLQRVTSALSYVLEKATPCPSEAT